MQKAAPREQHASKNITDYHHFYHRRGDLPAATGHKTDQVKMFKWLKYAISGRPRVEKAHVFFGRMLFMGGETPADDDYWESMLSIEGVEAPLTIIINAPKSGPADKQVVFCKKAISDLDALFEKCWPVFEPDFEQWTGKPFSGNWRDDFEILSIEIPRDGDDANEWAVGYYVDAAKHYFTARFINGKAGFNEIDG